MKARDFKKGLTNLLLAMGYEKSGKLLQKIGTEVSILIAFEQGFGDQRFINVGFWLHAIGNEAPSLLEQSHLYFRLERLFPQSQETIATAGRLSDPAQPSAYEELQRLFTDEFCKALLSLGDEGGLRAALNEGRLNHGLLRREAREHLASGFKIRSAP